MLTHRNLLTACFAALLALGLAACGTGGDGGPAAMMDDPADPVDPDPDPEPEPSDLDVAQTEAQDAADAAKGFATDAATDATAAVAAAMSRAWFQTIDPSSYKHAHDATTHAGYARTAAINAQTAADAAAAATTLPDAIEARLEAQRHQKSAEDHRGHVTVFHDDAVTVAATEVLVDGDVFSVGGRSIDTTAGKLTTAINDQTTITGLLDGRPMHMVAAIEGQDFSPGDDADSTSDDLSYRQAVAARMIEIGKTLDSPDDMARLMLVTQYAGTMRVNVYSPDETVAGADRTGTKVGFISVTEATGAASTVDTDLNRVRLKSMGMYVLAGADADDDGLTNGDMVAADAKSMEVFSYTVDAGTPDDATDDETVYVILLTTSTTGDTTTYTYREVDVIVAASRADGDDDNTTADDGQVMATLPQAVDYKHINFGVWAGLGAAAKSGSQKIGALGIGFVNNIGDGMTPIGGGADDMPNNGKATYEGDWVATVQEANVDGNGDISLETGAATLMANFGEGEIAATLTGLATLEGDIAGNMFSGTKATVGANDLNLTAGADFDGTFHGGFFGAKAAEAGGVFRFTSEDDEAGGFAGAFGGDKK